MLRIILCLVLLAVISASALDYHCEQHHRGIGCFEDLITANERTLATLLFNERNNLGSWWGNWPNHTHSIVCQCAIKAAESGFQFFAVQFFAECWAGNEATFLNHESNNCIDPNMQPCDPGQPREECIGKSSTNFVYGLLEHPEQVARPTKGNKPIAETSNCKSPMNIAIALDTSGSVSDEDFVKSKDFLKRFIASIGQSAKNSRFSLLHYDNAVYIDFGFNDDQRYQTLADTIDAINHTRGATVTQRALAVSLKSFNDAEGDAQKVLLVITDGRTHGGKKYLVEPIEKLKNEEVRVIAVGIGEGIHDAEEMGGKKHSIYVKSFDDLNKHLQNTEQLVCG